MIEIAGGILLAWFVLVLLGLLAEAWDNHARPERERKCEVLRERLRQEQQASEDAHEAYRRERAAQHQVWYDKYGPGRPRDNAHMIYHFGADYDE